MKNPKSVAKDAGSVNDAKSVNDAASVHPDDAKSLYPSEPECALSVQCPF